MIIPNSDLSRIESTLEDRIGSANTLKDYKLHRSAIERSSRWSNTLEAKRIQSENERSRQKIAEEALRQSIDIQEAQRQLQQRKLDIQRANQLIFQESDRMKLLHSSMMLSDVLAERENQIRIKTELRNLERIRDIKYEELAKHNNSKILERERQIRLEEVRKRKSLADDQKLQLLEIQRRHKDSMEADRIEGIILSDQNAQFIQDEINRKAQERQKKLAALQETSTAQAISRDMKSRENERSRIEEEKIKRHAEEAAHMESLRKKAQEDLLRSKQETRQRMIDRQAELLSSSLHRAEDRVAEHCRDAEANQDKLIAQRDIESKKWKDEILASRQAQLEDKRKNEIRQRIAEQKALEMKQMALERAQEDERKESLQIRSAEQQVVRDLQRQIASKKDKAAKERRYEAATVHRAKEAMHAEVREFQSFAEQAMQEYSSQGKTVIPIVHAIKAFHINNTL